MRHALRRWHLLLMLALGAGWAAHADAQQGGEPPGYRGIIQQALVEMRASRWDEARLLFERAHALYPNARTLRGLGVVSFEARDYVSTIAHMTQALADTRKPLTKKQRAQGQKILSQAQAFVGRFNVVLQPSEATLSVDGYPIQLQDGVLLLNPGEHDLVAEAKDYRRLQRKLDVSSGKTGELNLALEPAAPTTAVAPAGTGTPAEPETADGGDTPSLPLVPVITLGVGGALLVASIITGALTESARSELTDECGDGIICPRDLISTKERGEDLRTATHVLLAVGSVTTAAGVALWFLMDHGSPSEAAPPVALACDPGGCHGTLSGSF